MSSQGIAAAGMTVSKTGQAEDANRTGKEYSDSKSIEDSGLIRQKIFFAFEVAERETDPVKRRAWLTFVIVGSGPTGVELTGMVAEIARETLKEDFRSINPEESEILLVDAADRVLPAFPPELSEHARSTLRDLGVQVRTGVKVTAIDDEGIALEGPNGTERVATHTVLWAAGVAASPLGRTLAEKAGAKTDRLGRVIVDPDLTVPGHPEIFVIGDMAHLPGKDGNPLPGLAPVAMASTSSTRASTPYGFLRWIVVTEQTQPGDRQSSHLPVVTHGVARP